MKFQKLKKKVFSSSDWFPSCIADIAKKDPAWPKLLASELIYHSAVLTDGTQVTSIKAKLGDWPWEQQEVLVSEANRRS